MSDETEGGGGPGDKVKKAMAGKKPPPKLGVIDGGKSDKPAGKRQRPKKGAAESTGEDDGFHLYGEPPAPDDRPEPPDDAYEGDDGTPEGIDPEDLEIARECSLLDQNDRDNARRLIRWFGLDLAYVPGMGWIVFGGGQSAPSPDRSAAGVQPQATHWMRDEGELEVALRAQAVVDKIKLEAALLEHTPGVVKLLAAAERVEKKASADLTPADNKLLRAAEGAKNLLSARKSKRRSFAVTTGNRGRTVAMLAQAASMKAVDPKRLDANHMKFNVRNGTLTFSKIPDPERPEGSERMTGECVFSAERDRSDMITKVADVDYDPDATCPRWHAYLERMQPDADMRLFLQVAHAYALLIGGNDEQVVFFHYGQGANGKSILIETLGRLAGLYRAVVSPETFTGDQQKQGQQASPDIARLVNTRFVTVEELPRGVPLKENVIKAASGGTKMVARFLQKEFFEFDPIFTTVMSGNDLPQVSGTDYGIWRRLKIIPWEVTLPDGHPDRVPFGQMLAMLDAERSGILNWLIEGLRLYHAQGLTHFIPAKVKAFTEDYREERDNVGVFVESCVHRNIEGGRVKASDMFKAYTDWCEANGIKPYQQTMFGLRLNALGIQKEKGRTYTYLGVKLGSDLPTRFDAPDPPPPSSGDPGWQPSL